MYEIDWWGLAVDKFEELRLRAVDAGKVPELEYWLEEILSLVRDPGRASRVGLFIGQTDHPGGFCRRLTRGRLFVQYIVYPDRGLVAVVWVASTVPEWP